MSSLAPKPVRTAADVREMRAFLVREAIECQTHQDVDGLISIRLKAPRRSRELIPSRDNLLLDPALSLVIFARIVERQMAANEDRLVWGRLVGLGDWGPKMTGGVGIHLGMTYASEQSILHALRRCFGPARFRRFVDQFCR